MFILKYQASCSNIFPGVHDFGWILLSHDRPCPKYTLQEHWKCLTTNQEIRHQTAKEDHVFTHRTKTRQKCKYTMNKV